MPRYYFSYWYHCPNSLTNLLLKIKKLRIIRHSIYNLHRTWENILKIPTSHISGYFKYFWRTSINHDYTEKNFVKIFKKLTKYRSEDIFVLDYQNNYVKKLNAKNVLPTWTSYIIILIVQ